jgi:spermidine/putrescine transport system ATP-binding protein
VYITHDQSEALVMSDHVAVMHQGRFEQVGTPQDLYYQPQTPFVAGFVGANNKVQGRAAAVENGLVRVEGNSGLTLHAQASGTVRNGDTVQAFVRPEVASLARDARTSVVAAAELKHMADQDGPAHTILMDAAAEWL